MNRNINYISFLMFMLTAFTACSSHAKYDVLIKNGRIFDGSGSPGFTGDIGINADTIAVIGEIKKGSAELTIDAEGLAVAPGFINMLSWAVESLIEDGRS